MASAYLSRSITTSTDNTRFTISVWVKKLKQVSNSYQNIINSRQSGTTNGLGLWFGDNDEIFYNFGTSSSASSACQTNAKYRDNSAWYHIVLAGDASQSGTDKLKFYVNGEQITSFQTDNRSSFATIEYDLGNTTYPTLIGRKHDDTFHFDGCMAHFHFVDGTAYQASTFGETDATTGIWKPKTAPSVTYGTNGFFLKFENSGAFGTDSSGNGNNFTVNGTMTQTIDTPSNVFNVLNEVSNPTNGYTLSNGNTRATQTGSSFQRFYIANTIAPTSGKWYWESKLITSGGSDRTSIGICSYDENIGTGTTEPNNEVSIVTGISRIRIRENGSTTEVDGFYTIPSANDIFMYALDLDNTKFYFGINGNWWNYNTAETGGDPTSGSGYVTNSTNIIKSAMSAFLRIDAGAVSTTFTNEFNFGNGYFGTTAVSSAQNPDDGIGIFEYSVPTGYKALCTKSINAQEYS